MKIVTFDGDHVTPILRQWGIGLNDLGHDWDFYNINHSTISDCSKKDYDIVVCVGLINTQEVEKFKRENPKTKIVYAADCYHAFLSDLRGVISAVVTTQSEAPQFESECETNGFQLLYVPLAADNKTFFRNREEIQWDINFVGQFTHGNRDEHFYLYPLLEKYKCFTGGYNRFIPYGEINKIRNSSLLTINFHVPYQKEKGVRRDCNQTTFSGCLSNSLQIVDHPLAFELYNWNTAYAAKEDWYDTIDFYLNNNAAREEMRERAYEETLKNHLWKHRMSHFISCLNQIS